MDLQLEIQDLDLQAAIPNIVDRIASGRNHPGSYERKLCFSTPVDITRYFECMLFTNKQAYKNPKLGKRPVTDMEQVKNLGLAFKYTADGLDTIYPLNEWYVYPYKKLESRPHTGAGRHPIHKHFARRMKRWDTGKQKWVTIWGASGYPWYNPGYETVEGSIIESVDVQPDQPEFIYAINSDGSQKLALRRRVIELDKPLAENGNRYFIGKLSDLVKDVYGNFLLLRNAICIIDGKGHKKFLKASGEFISDLAGLKKVYTTLNLDNGGRPIAPGELEYLQAFISPKTRYKTKEVFGRIVHYESNKDLERIEEYMLKTFQSDKFTSEHGIPVLKTNVLGGGTIGVNQTFDLLSRSRSKMMTGGIGYSFGVEWETSFGDLTDEECKALMLSKQGDGSIDANEYVTKPLHGDIGMSLIDTYTSVLSQSCGITQKDSVHIHVGGAKGIDSPIYNLNFTKNAMLLAKRIEDEMFSIVPPHRRKTHYCSSVKEMILDDVTRDNIAEYIFGRELGFSRDLNRSKNNLSKWHGSRYKWLNLLNCNSVNGASRGGNSFKTVEFRLYPGSLNAEEIKSEILISLAFVWFVENKQGRIHAGDVTLGEIVDTAIKTPKESNMVLDFIDTKKQLYSKTN